jgi:hypothetical protein
MRGPGRLSPVPSFAVTRDAVGLLRPALEEAYEAAWAEWEAGEDAGAWSATDADGLGDLGDAAG